MEYIIIVIVSIILLIMIAIILDISNKKIKQIGNQKHLDELTEKYPSNIEICKYYLKKLNNEQVNIEEDSSVNSCLYIAMSNKIVIGNVKNSYTRIQTIAHECLHSIQDKKIQLFHFFFTNFYLIYFVIAIILTMFKIVPQKQLLLNILIILGFVFYFIRSYLEDDAMIKARFLAKEFMEEQNISSEEEIQEILENYDKLNMIGIKTVNFSLFTTIIVEVIIFSVICCIF